VIPWKVLWKQYFTYKMLINDDCLFSMMQLDAESVDLILCDLPYGTTDQCSKKNRVLKWDNIIPLDKLWECYKHVLKPKGTVVLTADQPFTSMLVMSNLDWFKYEWIWYKKRTYGFLHANARPMKQTEDDHPTQKPVALMEYLM
jgi:site-specific DNA-methyltransferase (adenine-specific)